MVKKIGTAAPLIALFFAALIAAGASYYFDPPPNPRPPKNCEPNEIRVFDDGWFCVLARKP